MMMKVEMIGMDDHDHIVMAFCSANVFAQKIPQMLHRGT